MPGKMRYPRQWEWPKGAKIAMSVNLALEAFRFKSQYTQEGRPGRVDHFSLSYAEYGAKAGIWRILDFLDEVGLKGSMSTNGKAAELYPEACRAVAEAGHEFVGHGWENDVLTDEDNPDAELDGNPSRHQGHHRRVGGASGRLDQPGQRRVGQYADLPGRRRATSGTATRATTICLMSR